MFMMIKKAPLILFHSGLGNQLFQWALFHTLRTKGESVRPGFVPSLFSDSRKLQIASLLTSQGYTLIKFSNFEYRFERKLSSLNKNSKFLMERYLDYSQQPFTIPSAFDLKKARTIFGYFQRVSFIEKNQSLIIPPLANYLDTISLPLGLKNEPYNIIHVRGGDLLSASNKIKYGVLSLDYYARLRINTDYRTLIVTDDIDYAEQVSKVVHADEILGPKSLNEWQAFKLMSLARHLYCANSTFSLWASLLVLEKHNEAYLPRPFFRDTTFDKEEALNLSRANSIQSVFLD